MASPESAQAQPRAPRGGWLRRILASRITTVVACVLAAAVLVAGTISVMRWLDNSPQQLTVGAPMPSAFPLFVSPASSPFIQRGETIGVTISSDPAHPIERLELWADDQPYIVIDDPDLIPQSANGTVQLTLDYVPVIAGAHTLMARAIDSKGSVALSAPFAAPVMDQPYDIALVGPVVASGSASDMRFHSAPGDTIETIANRLGVLPSAIGAFEPFEVGAVLPTGTALVARIPSLDGLEAKLRYPTSDWMVKLTAKVSDCSVTVTSNATYDLRVYGGGGMVAIGDLPAGGELVLGTLPIGPTILAGFKAGQTSPTLTGEDAPTAPVTVVIPDECAKSGWTGDAIISGGLLITEAPVSFPYAYVSIDKQAWQRVPAAEGTYFASGETTVSDLRSYLSLTAYDQVDLEVWSSSSGMASFAASGQFCRTSMKNAGGLGSSQSGGECDPPGDSPGQLGGGAPLLSLDLSIVKLEGKAVQGVAINDYAPDEAQVGVTGPATITLKTNAAELGYDNVLYQFSYFPLSEASLLPNAPGVFNTIGGPANGTMSFNPWTWHDLKLTDEQLEGSGDLALDDEMALTIARNKLLEGHNLVDDLYVRAISFNTDPVTKKIVPGGGATASMAVTMPSGLDGTWPEIANPTLSITPGVDQNASSNGVNRDASWGWDPSIQFYGTTEVTNNCLEIVQYPQPGTYLAYPTYGPVSRKTVNAFGVDVTSREYSLGYLQPGDYYGPPREGYTQIFDGQFGYSDLEAAKRLWPTADYIYCQDVGSYGKRYTAAYEAAKEAAKCTLGCVLAFVFYGAITGLQAGGPWGALIGAIAGLAVGLISVANPAFYADIKQAWDEIAGFFNKVYDKISEWAAKVNLVCIGIGAISDSDEAQDICNKISDTAGKAVIYYYTGIPPSLKTSAELEALADGNLEKAIVVLIDKLLAELGVQGLSCETLTLDADKTAAMNKVADQFDVDVADLNAAAKNSNGELSACTAIAKTLTKKMRSAINERQGALMQAITGMPSYPGLITSLVADTTPTIRISGDITDSSSVGATCPAIINQKVTEDGHTYQWPAYQATLKRYYGIETAAGPLPADTPYWSVEMPVGVSPQARWYPFDRTNDATKAELSNLDEQEGSDPRYRYVDTTKLIPLSGAATKDLPYLVVEVDSPCFDSILQISVDKYSVPFGSAGAFALDNRSVVGYW